MYKPIGGQRESSVIPMSHLIMPKQIFDIMDIKRAYPGNQEFETIVETASAQGTIKLNMPFTEFRQRFENALGVEKC